MRCLYQPYKSDLSALLFEPSFKALVGPTLHTKLDLIRKLGNLAVHSSKAIRAEDAIAALRELFHFSYWLGHNYGLKPTDKPDPKATFNPGLLPKTSLIPAQTQAQLQTLAEQLKARDEQLAATHSRLSEAEPELQQLRQEVAQAKAANKAQSDDHDYTEDQTCDYFIDLLLKEAGWSLTTTDLDELERILLESGIGTLEHLEYAKETSQGLGLFIRSLVGLDREAAKQALGQFLSGSVLSADQIEFINLIMDHLTHHGIMDPGLLYESPFTDINAQGPEGVFSVEQVDALVSVLSEIRAAAAA